MDVDDPSEKIEEKADKFLKEMTDFADELVGVKQRFLIIRSYYLVNFCFDNLLKVAISCSDVTDLPRYDHQLPPLLFVIGFASEQEELESFYHARFHAYYLVNFCFDNLLKDFGSKSLKAMGPQIWNCLPNEIKSADNLNSFKRMIKQWDGPSCKCNV